MRLKNFHDPRVKDTLRTLRHVLRAINIFPLKHPIYLCFPVENPCYCLILIGQPDALLVCFALLRVTRAAIFYRALAEVSVHWLWRRL